MKIEPTESNIFWFRKTCEAAQGGNIPAFLYDGLELLEEGHSIVIKAVR